MMRPDGYHRNTTGKEGQHWNSIARKTRTKDAMICATNNKVGGDCTAMIKQFTLCISIVLCYCGIIISNTCPQLIYTQYYMYILFVFCFCSLPSASSVCTYGDWTNDNYKLPSTGSKQTRCIFNSSCFCRCSSRV
jgi:hypothetical protein